MSKNVILKGTLILTIAGILTKLLGFYNRIFLTRVIGVKELGIYQLIFPIYILVISFCCQGIGTAITKHVSYYLGRNEENNSKSVFKLGLSISLVLSIICMLILCFLSTPISIYILKNSQCDKLLKIISIALPFIAIKNCINAYFIGKDNPKIQGLSHFVEQLVRIIAAYVLVYIVCIDYNAVLATLSVVTGEIISGIINLIIIYFYKTKEKTTHKCRYASILTKSFLKDAIPITGNNLIFTLFASLEAIILPAMLFKYYANSDTAMELYGIITGIVIPFLLFPATITTAISTMLLPAISNAKAHENYNKIKDAIFLCVSFCLIQGVLAYIGYTFLGKWACEIAFKSINAGIILTKMCFICPFIYVCGVLSTILNGLDKAFINMLINVGGLIIRILFIAFLVPRYGLGAYVFGMLTGYILMMLLMGLSIRDVFKEKALKLVE